MHRLGSVIALVTVVIASAPTAGADGFAQANEALTVNLRNLSYVQLQEPSDQAIELGLSLSYPEELVQNDLRADILFAYGPMQLELRPRADIFWQSWTSGTRAGQDEFGAELYFYEWLARASVGQKAFVEYGLLNLQWGPSFLLSPSNPFDQRNGKDNPKLELPAAMDYARLIWLPSTAWTISLIANVDEGRKRYERDFHPTYALKADYVFQDGYASLIGSFRDNDNPGEPNARVGFYALYNISDRLLGYTEGGGSEEDRELLVGASYTTAVGPTLVLEYFFNSNGTNTDIRQLVVDSSIDTRRREAFLRKNYVLLQAYQRDVFGNLDYVLRWVASPDDRSHAMNLQLDLGVSEMMTLFAVATVNIGDDTSELNAVRSYQVMAGVEIAF